ALRDAHSLRRPRSGRVTVVVMGAAVGSPRKRGGLIDRWGWRRNLNARRTRKDDRWRRGVRIADGVTTSRNASQSVRQGAVAVHSWRNRDFRRALGELDGAWRRGIVQAGYCGPAPRQRYLDRLSNCTSRLHDERHVNDAYHRAFRTSSESAS